MIRKPKNKKIIFGVSNLLFHIIGMRHIPPSGTKRGTPHCLTHCVHILSPNPRGCPDNCCHNRHDTHPEFLDTSRGNSLRGQPISWPQAPQVWQKGVPPLLIPRRGGFRAPDSLRSSPLRLTDITRFACLYLFLKMFEYSNQRFIYEC